MGRGQLKYNRRGGRGRGRGGGGGRGGGSSSGGGGGGSRGARRGGARTGGSWTGGSWTQRRERRGGAAARSSAGRGAYKSVLESRIPLKKNGPALGLQSGGGGDGGADAAFTIDFDELASSIAALSSERRLGHVIEELPSYSAKEDEKDVTTAAAAAAAAAAEARPSADVDCDATAAAGKDDGDEDEDDADADAEGDAWLDDLLG
jgi:hypothetical protein